MVDILKKSNFFKSIDTDKIQKILYCIGYRIKKINKDNYSYELSTNFKAFIVLDGIIDIISLDENGTETINCRYLPNDSFAFDFNTHPGYIIKAKEEAKMIVININNIYDEQKKCCQLRALFMENIILEMQRQLAYLTFKMELYTKISLRDKIFTFLGYECKKQKSSKINLIYNIEDLAKFLACNRSALSREISRLEKEKIIKKSNHIIEINNNIN